MKVIFITLGCKVNQYETNAMAQKFIEKGYDVLENQQKADIYIINTCTVTNMSDRKSRQMLRRVKEKNNKAIVVACGCYAQIAKEELEKIKEIDLILGNNEKKEIVKYVEEYIQKKEKVTEIEDVMYQKNFVDFGDITYTEKTRAVIKVQDGCDRFCSYCIIPYARGRIRSREPKSIISEIKKIAQEGIKEVVITGIHVASYGKDFKAQSFENDKLKVKREDINEQNNNEYRLIDLLEEINKIDGIQRIRLSSIEPLLITEDFIKRLKKLEKICPHFHLSLQSGCNETLKRMNRRYTCEEFKKIVERIRNNFENPTLTTDIIVGFPQESEDEFEKTYKFLKEIEFYKMHVFKYSPRKGTKAAQMLGQVDGNIKEERSQKLIELSNQNEKKYNETYIGKEVEVLFEEEKDGIYKGHTKNYILAYLPKEQITKKEEQKLENEILQVKCYKVANDHIVTKM